MTLSLTAINCHQRKIYTWNLLVIRAKDGRGEILRYQDGNILTQKLTLEDVDKFKKINSILDEKVAEVQAEQQLQANRRRGRGLSL